jgi:lactoylglutathione lyase
MSVTTHELRIALTVDDYDAAVAFYGAVLGMALEAQWDQPQGRGGVFAVPRATLEILDREMAEGVDAFEVGRRVSGDVRLALGVGDVAESMAAATAAGAIEIGTRRQAPWGDEVGRVQSPEGLQLTLFSTDAA